MGQKIISWGAPVFRVVSGTVLVVSGYLKAVRPSAEFAATLESYWIFPTNFVAPIAHVVPWIEMFVGLALVVGFMTRGSAFVAAGLYATFVVVLVQSIFRKLPMADCGCFGQMGPSLTPLQSVSLDVGLLIFCLFIFLDRDKRMSIDLWIQRS